MWEVLLSYRGMAGYTAQFANKDIVVKAYKVASTYGLHMCYATCVTWYIEVP